MHSTRPSNTVATCAAALAASSDDDVVSCSVCTVTSYDEAMTLGTGGGDGMRGGVGDGVDGGGAGNGDGGGRGGIEGSVKISQLAPDVSTATQTRAAWPSR